MKSYLNNKIKFMKITITIKENTSGNLEVTINELKKNKTTKDSEFICACNVKNAIIKALDELKK